MIEPLNFQPKGDPTHVLLNNRNEATFVCSNCGNGVTRNLSELLHAKTAIRVRCRCKCGHVFRVLVERRRNDRRLVNLLGMCHYLDPSGHTQKRLIKVLDISSTGLQFSINSLPEFKVGAKISVEFKLDDRENTEIHGEAIVKRVRLKNIGLQLASIKNHKQFSLYLIH